MNICGEASYTCWAYYYRYLSLEITREWLQRNKFAELKKFNNVIRRVGRRKCIERILRCLKIGHLETEGNLLIFLEKKHSFKCNSFNSISLPLCLLTINGFTYILEVEDGRWKTFLTSSRDLQWVRVEGVKEKVSIENEMRLK